MDKPLLRHPFATVFLLSLTLITQEVIWTRIFSAEFYYTFAFLILSLAVLGLGLGGLIVRLFPSLSHPARISWVLSLTAILSLAGPVLVLHLDLNFAHALGDWAMFGKLVLTLFLLGSSFFTGGVALSTLFRYRVETMPRLYMFDLLGAGLGILGAVGWMNLWGTPAAALLAVLPLALAALLSAHGRPAFGCSLLVLIAPLALLPWADQILSKPRQERALVLHRHWDAMALIKILEGKGSRGINIDNLANTPVSQFDGNWEDLQRQPSSFLVDPQPLMERCRPSCRFLSIGSGGGGDVLLALKNEAREVHALEVNSYINRILSPGGMLFDYSGKIYQDPRVRVITEDARSYVRRFENRFDIIYSFSSNTFAALAGGAFALAENYLFTTEAFSDYYRALAPQGYLLMEHQFYMNRMVSEALDALRQAGLPHPERHLAIYSSPQTRRQLMLLGKRPLSAEEIQAPVLALREKDFQLMHRVYPDPEPKASPIIHRIVSEGWQAVSRDVPTDLSPATDDRPFIAHQGLMKNFRWETLRSLESFEIRGFPLAWITVLSILAIVLLLIVPLNLLPYLTKGPKLPLGHWLYFFCIGFGFMALEVILIQKYTLFLGTSAYTLVVILFSLLLGSGVGSRLSARFGDRLPFLAIVVWLVLEMLLFDRGTVALSGLPLAARILTTALVIFPLGFFMGMPFPKGAAKVGSLIDWGFAVNGAASVLGSTAALLISLQWGFTAGLALGGVAYLGAWAVSRTRLLAGEN